MPGPWRPEVAPYLIDVCEAFTRPEIETVVLCCASQEGKTELIFNLLGWTVTDNPRPCMYVGPTQDQVRDISRDRFDKMIRLTPCLADNLDPRASRQNVYERWINTAKMSFAWAGSSSQLASKPAAIVLVDERDRMGADVKGEGDPVEIVRARTKNYHNRKIGIFSTPTVEGASPIWEWFDAGTMRRWAWACPDCDEWFVPTLELLRYPEDAKRSNIRDSARIVCPHCGVEIDNDTRRTLRGRYIAHTKGDDGTYTATDTPERNSVESFWVSGLASPFTSLGEIAEALAQAWSSRNQERIQAAVNTFGGELYRVEGDSPGWRYVWDKRESYDRPAGVQMVTCGVDVQKRSLYYVIRGWGHNAESWLLAHGQLHGQTEFDSVWLALANVLEEQYAGRYVLFTLIDSGYAADAVYKFCRARIGRVAPAKSWNTLDRPHKDSLVDEHPSGRVKKAGLRLWHVNSDYYKTWVYSRIRWPAGESGDWRVSSDVDEDYCQQVTNEQRVQFSSGKVVWKKTGSRENHYLDCEALATCAAMLHNAQSLPQIEQRREAAQPQPEPARPARVPRNPSFVRQGM